jgi:predicted DNA-binding transcriptional regulator AlpA
MKTPTLFLRDRIGAFLPKTMEILTPAQVAERLHVKPTWVYEQTRKRMDVRSGDPFPHIKMGRYLRFDWKDVEAWLERQKRGSVTNEHRRFHR